jgi:hypothetical protein
MVAATQIDLVGPAGSGAFGRSVTVLPNGNIVVTDPYYDAGATGDVGAVYLYAGATGALISTLTGSTAGDRVGYFGVTALSNGNYVVRSPYWVNGAVADAGAVTWGDGMTGVSGVVSVANSLVGSTAGDQVGIGDVVALSNGNYVVWSPQWHNGGAEFAGAVTWGDGTMGTAGVVSAANSLVGSTANDLVGRVTALSNGNYLVGSPDWDNGPAADAGMVTWGDGTGGTVGVVSEANSLVGSTASDRIGYYGVWALSNGNYLVWSPDWDNGAAADAGAVTWGDGSAGTSGPVSAANSLVGGNAYDEIGTGGGTVLSNGNYVVCSPSWDNGAVDHAGAVTWGDGTTGVSGVVSAANSLVGSTASDGVGNGGVTALSNGNYVVSSPTWHNGGEEFAGAVTWGDGTTGTVGVVSEDNSLVGSTAHDGVGDVMPLSNGNYVVASPTWDNGALDSAGAVTWGDGTTGIAGPVSAANSLVGSTAGEVVGNGGVTPLSTGNYVVASPSWDNGAVSGAGAVTWGDGTTGTVGVVSVGNSLVGSTADDWIGYGGVTALSNGNYVVSSPNWHNSGVLHAGAATWGDGTTGTVGVVSAANSLVGSTAFDEVGDVTVLSNGNYLVRSPDWDNGAEADAGAVAWGDGTAGTVGAVSAANSLVGSTAGDQVGSSGVALLSNGHYVVGSPNWDNGALVDVGAATWGDGTTGIVGLVSASNSLVGSTAGDRVGSYYPHTWALSSGDYVLLSPYWDNGATVDAGAVTWGNGTDGAVGSITAENSVRGTAENGGESMRWAYDGMNHQLVVGRPGDNMVTLFRPLALDHSIYLPVILKNTP